MTNLAISQKALPSNKVMGSYLLKRLLTMIPTLFGITLITFAVVHLTPGDPAKLKIKMSEMGQSSPVTQEMIEQTRKLYGLDKPLHVQYGIWLKRLLKLDFGDSFKDGRPVMDKLKEHLPITLILNAISISLIYLIAVPLGVLSAIKRRSLVDNILTVILFILYSLPSFFVALMLIIFFAGGDVLDWFPAYGIHSEGAEEYGAILWVMDFAWHLVLPVTCLTYGGLAYLSRMSRIGMLDVIRQDYIRTARAKGLSEKVVIMKHAFRNSLIPIVTLMAGLLPAMLGGSVIIEKIFSIRGMGLLTFDAILSRDYPLIMGIFTLASFLTLLGLLFSDILYALVDPRISFGELSSES